MKKYLSVKQFAHAIGKSSQWVWFLIKTKAIKAKMVGNQYIIDTKEINKLNYKQTQEVLNESQ